MGGFTLGKMIFGSLFKQPETIQYPIQTKEPPAGLKGHVHNNVDDCILCGICAKKCTADAIEVDKDARTWSINRFRCIQCYYCVRSCPKKCLEMKPTYPTPASSKNIDTYDVPEKVKEAKPAATSDKPLSQLEKLAKLDPEKAAKVKAALEAKAKRDSEKVAQADAE